MPLRAMAFHEAISVQKLEEIFKSDKNVVFGGTLGGACANCKAKFAVFFPAKDDPHNLDYLAKLNEVIAKDCRCGKHAGEYSFSTTP
jgi:hypothetical protein